MPVVLARIIYGTWTLLVAMSLTSNVMRFLRKKGVLPTEEEMKQLELEEAKELVAKSEEEAKQKLVDAKELIAKTEKEKTHATQE